MVTSSRRESRSSVGMLKLDTRTESWARFFTDLRKLVRRFSEMSPLKE